jgi:hypothetical protein
MAGPCAARNALPLPVQSLGAGEVGSCRKGMIAQEIVTVRKSVLGEPRGSLAHERDKIIAALDMLFTGL